MQKLQHLYEKLFQVTFYFHTTPKVQFNAIWESHIARLHDSLKQGINSKECSLFPKSPSVKRCKD